MKLMNLRALDPQYTIEGKIRFERGAQSDREAWSEFANDPLRCRQVAEAIKSSIANGDADAVWPGREIDDDIQEAPEGRLLTHNHLARERNRRLVKSRRQQAIRGLESWSVKYVVLIFSVCYGARGTGFIECHHMKPVATLGEGQKTHIDDLALVCANCHRIIHRCKPWISIEQLRLTLAH